MTDHHLPSLRNPLSSLHEQARRVMYGNLVTTVGGRRYTRPAPMTYEHQWLWDSCFHAIAYTHFDLAMAQEEIETLLAGQVTKGPDEGMVPHMIYWRGGGAELWGRDDRSTITQPPIIALAVERVYETTEDVSFLNRVYPALAAYHEWWTRRRDPDRDGLVSCIHPWETGWDAAPAWDALLGLKSPSDEESRKARFELVAKIAKLGYDLEAIQEAGLFNVETADFNALYTRSLQAMQTIARKLGRQAEAEQWGRRAEQTTAALQAHCWDEKNGLFLDVEGRYDRSLGVRSAGMFITLIAGVPTHAQAERLVQRLTSPDEFWTAVPVPSVSLREKEFAPDRYWRGPAWAPINWLIIQGLRRYNYHPMADELAHRFEVAVERSGFWEYFNPHTGAGLGAHPQSWTALVLDMR